MIPARITNTATKNPKTLFLIDCVGALVSVFLLTIVLGKFESVFGIPRATLFFLALFPCLFAVYDLNCFIWADRNLGLFLKIISILNLAYCIISILTAIYKYKDILLLGWVYIVVEIVIVTILARIEYEVGRSIDH